MAVYVDETRPALISNRWPWRHSCHLFADDTEALHTFASRLGLRRFWFQPRNRFPHYDLTPNLRAKAVELGAIEVDAAFVVRCIHETGIVK